MEQVLKAKRIGTLEGGTSYGLKIQHEKVHPPVSDAERLRAFIGAFEW